jgi:hypothetical protein
MVLELDFLRENGFARFVEARTDHYSTSELADLGVMSMLNSKKVWGEAAPARKFEAAHFLKSIGDFRVKVLTQEAYQTVGL